MIDELGFILYSACLFSAGFTVGILFKILMDGDE